MKKLTDAQMRATDNNSAGLVNYDFSLVAEGGGVTYVILAPVQEKGAENHFPDFLPTERFFSVANDKITEIESTGIISTMGATFYQTNAGDIVRYASGGLFLVRRGEESQPLSKIDDTRTLGLLKKELETQIGILFAENLTIKLNLKEKKMTQVSSKAALIVAFFDNQGDAARVQVLLEKTGMFTAIPGSRVEVADDRLMLFTPVDSTKSNVQILKELRQTERAIATMSQGKVTFKKMVA